MTQEKAPGSPFLWTLAGGFSESFEDIEKGEWIGGDGREEVAVTLRIPKS